MFDLECGPTTLSCTNNSNFTAHKLWLHQNFTHKPAPTNTRTAMIYALHFAFLPFTPPMAVSHVVRLFLFQFSLVISVCQKGIVVYSQDGAFLLLINALLQWYVILVPKQNKLTPLTKRNLILHFNIAIVLKLFTHFQTEFYKVYLKTLTTNKQKGLSKFKLMAW